MTEFYLTCDDYVSQPEPRRCRVVSTLRGKHRAENFYLVSIEPSLNLSVEDEMVFDIDKLVLGLIGEVTLDSIGIVTVMVYVIYSNSIIDGIIDEHKSTRIGTGGLFKTYFEALEDSPIE